MFLCGAEHAPNEEFSFVGITHLLDRDATLRETLDLGDFMEAERASVGGEWSRQRLIES
jgi:hypothetical protein